MRAKKNVAESPRVRVPVALLLPLLLTVEVVECRFPLGLVWSFLHSTEGLALSTDHNY